MFRPEYYLCNTWKSDFIDMQQLIGIWWELMGTGPLLTYSYDETETSTQRQTHVTRKTHEILKWICDKASLKGRELHGNAAQ